MAQWRSVLVAAAFVVVVMATLAGRVAAQVTGCCDVGDPFISCLDNVSPAACEDDIRLSGGGPFIPGGACVGGELGSCTGPKAPAPTMSRNGLLMTALVLAGVGMLQLLRRRSITA